jgi:DNA-directed RNA polymerase subunit beta'
MSHYFCDELHLRDRVKLWVRDEHIETTVGRVIFNNALPEKARFLNHTVDKRGLKKVLDRIFDLYGREEMVRVADEIKDM